jgi:hypothetical protein
VSSGSTLISLGKFSPHTTRYASISFQIWKSEHKILTYFLRVKLLLTFYLNFGRQPTAIALLKVVKEIKIMFQPEFTRPVFLMN